MVVRTTHGAFTVFYGLFPHLAWIYVLYACQKRSSVIDDMQFSTDSRPLYDWYVTVYLSLTVYISLIKLWRCLHGYWLTRNHSLSSSLLRCWTVFGVCSCQRHCVLFICILWQFHNMWVIGYLKYILNIYCTYFTWFTWWNSQTLSLKIKQMFE